MARQVKAISKGGGRARLYGVTLETPFPFAAPLSPAEPGAPTELTLVVRDPASGVLERSAVGRVRVPGVADYVLERERITAMPAPGSDGGLVELHFLSSAMTAWLERRGTLALHASAVVAGCGAIAFLAENRGGKTALAATFAQAGCPLLTDDILALEPRADGRVVAHAGYPQMRMWEDNARHFVGSGWRRLSVVHPGYPKVRVGMTDIGASFHAGAVPLRALVLPCRSPDADTDISMRRSEIAAGAVALLRHVFAPPTAADWPAQAHWRLASVSRAIESVPLFTLEYPSGYGRLVEVRERVLARLGANLPQANRRAAG